MKAIQLPQPEQVTLIDIPKPTPKAGEALIRVVCAGVCGSDIGALRGTNPLVSYPRVIGHEIAGEIVEINANDKGLKVGDRVIVDPYLFCGSCYPCSLGRTNCCTDLKVLGVHVDGGMAEYFTHPAHMLHKVPDSIPWNLVPLAEPLTIALHGLHRGGLKAGEHLAIFGAGPIGLLAAMGAMHYKAVPILIDPIAERLAMAGELGVKHLLQPDAQLSSRVAQITNGRFAEMVMECSGSNAAIRSCLELVSNAGRVVFTGWPKHETPLPTDVFTKKEIDVRGARTSAGEFGEALELIASKSVDVAAILTKTVSIDEAPAVIADMDKNPQNYLKVHVSI